jgi:hypothetical protein
VGDALLALVRELLERKIWNEDQAVRFRATRTLGLLEATIAPVEVLDPDRRGALGRPEPASPSPDQADLDDLGYRFSVAWLGARTAAEVRAIAAEEGLGDAWTPEAVRRAGGPRRPGGRPACSRG